MRFKKNPAKKNTLTFKGGRRELRKLSISVIN
jgi:hypothetical protein